MLSRFFTLLLIVIVTGCGAQQEAPQKAASQDAPSASARLEPCQLLSRAEVEEALGTRVADGQSSDTAEVLGSSSDALRQCSFYGEDDPADLRLVLSVMRAPESTAQFEQQLAMAKRLAGVEGARVAGIGDAAVWFRESGSLKVMTGNVQFVIDDVASKDAAAEPGAALRKLALTVVKRRPVFEAVASENEDMEDDEDPPLTWWDSRQSQQAKQFSVWIEAVEGLWISGATEHSQKQSEVLSKVRGARIQNWLGEIDALEGPRQARTSMTVFTASDGGLMINLAVPEDVKADPSLEELAIGDIVEFSGKIQSIEGGAFGTREPDTSPGAKPPSRDKLLQSLRPTTLNAEAAEITRVTKP